MPAAGTSSIGKATRALGSSVGVALLLLGAVLVFCGIAHPGTDVGVIIKGMLGYGGLCCAALGLAVLALVLLLRRKKGQGYR